MKCPRCQCDNPAGASACGQCGVSLDIRCGACGAQIPVGFRFCGQCGAPLVDSGRSAVGGSAPPRTTNTRTTSNVTPRSYTPKHLAEKIVRSRSALEGERRQVTVLFADVAGFTQLAERLDPEDVHRLINRCFDIITAEVHRFEGTINQYTGDGVMALFGAPIAHEDSPRRAVHAALAIQRGVGELSREYEAERGLVVRMRIGLNTGPVVVGTIGDDLRMDYTAVGDTTNLAARMQQVGRPDTVYVSEATHHLIAGFFETRDLGALTVKGHTAVRAFEVIRARGRRSRFDVAAERGLTSFVGRAREIDTMLECFAEARQGRGQVVTLIGEAGIGKSRLLLELRRRLAAAATDFTWLEGQCVAFGQSAFLPIVDQLRRSFGIDELDGEPEIIAKVEDGMRRIGQLEAATPFVRFLLSVDPGDPAVALIDPGTRRKKVFDAVRALTLRNAARRPLVLVFEDLHWVDRGTEEYLATLLDAVADVPLLLALTYRVGYAPPFAAKNLRAIHLSSLSEADSMALAGGMLGHAHLPRELRETLLAKAEGVPLFLEEVTRTLIDLGVLRRSADDLVIARSLDDVRVPDTIQGIIMARLDRLGDEGKRAMQVASVIGRQFHRRLLQRVTGMADGLDPLLTELKALEILYEQGQAPEPVYVFTHALIQDVAYNSLLREKRRELHRAVGNAIEELHADRLAEHHDELAHHFSNGEDWPKAFAYLVHAGNRAKDAYANPLALDHYEKALAAAERVSPPLAARRLFEVYQRRSQVWLSLSRYAEAIGDGERALALAQGEGDRRGEGEALLDLALSYWATLRHENVQHAQRYTEQALAIARATGDEVVLARSLGSLALVDQVDGRLEDADVKLAESLRIAERGGHTRIMVPNRVWIGAHANWRGDFRRAVPLCRQAEEVAADAHDSFHELMALAFRCLALIGLGEHREGLRVIHEGLGKAREWGNLFIVGRLTNTLGWLHQELGDFRAALEQDREAVAIGQQARNANVEVSALINLAYDHLNLGEPRRALPLLEDTLTRVDTQGFGAHRWRWSNHLTLSIAETLIAVGELERARTQARAGLAQARAIGSMKYISKAHTLLGEVAVRQGAWMSAEQELHEALRVAQAIGYPTLTWQAADLLARAIAQQGRADDARAVAAIATTTINAIAAAAPTDALRATFLAWPRVHTAQETAARFGSPP